MRFSVGHDLDSFFSGLGEEGRLKSHIADSQVITFRALLFLQIFNYLGHFWSKQVYCFSQVFYISYP